MERILENPFPVALTLLALIAFARGQATYWIARVVTEQTLARTHPVEGWRAGVHDWLQDQGPQRGRQVVQRGGLVMIPLCYLTLGFQTLVLAGAGMLRISWPVFTLVQIPGALVWGLIYATIGFAVWGAALAALAGSPLALAGLIAILLLIVTTLVLAHRRKQDRAHL